MYDGPQPSPYCCTAALGTPNVFPARYATDSLAYSIDVSCALASGEAISSAEVALAPSGAGEMQISGLSVAGTIITFLPTGGVPGRAYVYELLVTTNEGNTYTFLIDQSVNFAIANYPIPAAPSAGFGAEVICTNPSPIVSPGPAYITALGTNQATAAVLTAQTSIINAGAAGTGVRLPASLACSAGASLTIINPNAVDELLYPNGSDSIALGTPGEPITIPALTGYLTVNLPAGATQWVVS
jgi:hypothetical protein